MWKDAGQIDLLQLPANLSTIAPLPGNHENLGKGIPESASMMKRHMEFMQGPGNQRVRH